MNRKLAAGLAGLVAVALAAWFFTARHHAAAPPAPAATAKPVANDPWATTAPAKHDGPAPRGQAPEWALDVDPEGSLRLEGQVVAPDGGGVAGATVHLSSVPPRTATTQGDGSFAFDKLVGRTYAISAKSGALRGGPVTLRLTATSDPAVIHLAAGAALAITVSDDKGQPIAGAELRARDEPDTTAKSDAHGKATLAPLKPGWIVVSASAAGFALGSGVATVGSAGATGELAITLHTGVAVSGRVIDEAGKPLAKVNVTAADSNPWLSARSAEPVTTDEAGRFTFAALAPGSHQLTATDGDHEPVTTPPITVAQKPIDKLELTMKAGGWIAGVVVDTAGKPVASATVRVAGSGPRMFAVAARQVTTDAHGAFELRGLRRAKLRARAESDTAASKLVDVDLEAKPAARDVRLVLDVAGTIAGTVVDSAGQPVPEVAVNAFPDVLAGAKAEGAVLAGMSSATTDGGGRFTIHGLPDGQYRLWAGRPAGFDNWGHQGTTAKTGDTAVKIVLPANGGIKGTLQLANGSPPKLASVQVGERPSTPAAGGAFEIDDVEAGTYDVSVRGPEFAEFQRRDVVVEPGKTTDLGALSLVRGRVLTGRVVDPNGSPVAGATIRVGTNLIQLASGDDQQMDNLTQAAGTRLATSDQDGAFTVIGVPPKATNAMADQPDIGRSIALAIPAGTDDPPPITLALRGFGSIVGKVTSKGQPVGSVTVTATAQGGGNAALVAQTADDGTFTMAKVPESTQVLNALQMGLMQMKGTSATVTVVAGKTSTVTIDIPAGTITLTVQVSPLAGAKLDSAQVFLIRGTTSPPTAKELTDGALQGAMQGMKFWFAATATPPAFDELIAGDYSVCAIPITGDLGDPTFRQRLQQNVQTLKVSCTPVKLTAAPDQQSASIQLPAMAPLPP